MRENESARVPSEAEHTEKENTPIVLERTASTTSSAGSSVHSGVSLNRKAEGLSLRVLLMLRLPLSALYCPDQQFAALRAAEAKILAECIPGPHRATLFRGHRRAKGRQ